VASGASHGHSHSRSDVGPSTSIPHSNLAASKPQMNRHRSQRDRLVVGGDLVNIVDLLQIIRSFVHKSIIYIEKIHF